MGHYSVNLRKWTFLVALTLATSVLLFASASEEKTTLLNCSHIKIVHLSDSRRVQPSLKNVSGTDYWQRNTPKRKRRSPIVYEFPREALYSPPPPIHYQHAYSNDHGPEEGSYNHHPRFYSPPPPRIPRRPPPPLHRRLPAARHGLPPPRRFATSGGPGRTVHHRPTNYNPRRIPQAKPSYSYPREAANIQDILTYFQKEEGGYHPNNAYRPRPSPATPDMSAVSMGGDFSKELHDVQTSLLKDIREFAQRPNLMYNSPKPIPVYTSPTTIPPSIKSSSYNYDTRLPVSGDDMEPKAKPVRDMIKDHPVVPLPRPSSRSKSRLNGWAGEESREDHHKQRSRDRYRGEEDTKHGQSHPNHASRERRPDRHLPEDESEEPEHEPKEDVRRIRPRIKQNTEQYHRYVGGKYKSSSSEREEISDESDSQYHDLDRHRNHRYGNHWKVEQRDAGESSNSRPQIKPNRSPKPIVLKKPYGPYKSVPEATEQFDRPKFWGSNENPREQDDRFVKSHRPRHRRPTTSPGPVQKTLEEDIGESQDNAGGPYKLVRQNPPRYFHSDDDEREEPDRKNRLHKLYLEYLEKKLEAETLAAVAATSIPGPPYYPAPPSPPPPPRTPKIFSPPPPPPPMSMKIHIYPNDNSDGPGRDRNYNYHRPLVVLPPPRHSYSTPPPPHYPQPPPPQRRYPTSYMNFNQRMDSYQSPGPIQPPNNRNYAGGQKTGGPSTGVDKNKNLVLHLHVHRRPNDEMGDSLAGASEIHTTTVKPLTYKEIYDQVQEQQQLEQRKGYGNTGGSDSSSEPANKSLSVELPLQEERIQDVLHSILKYRER